MPEVIRPIIPEWLAAAPQTSFVTKKSKWDILEIRRYLENEERRYSPNIVFTVFGPAYFRARCPHVCGFALPGMLYPWHPLIDSETKLGREIANRVRRHLLLKMDCLIVETSSVRERLRKALGDGAPEIAIVRNAVNPRLLSNFQKDEAIRHLPINKQRETEICNIFVPSAYYKHKNLECIPMVARELRRIAPDDSYCFTMTLDETSHGWERISADAIRLSVRSMIRNVGPLEVEKLKSLYRASDVVFLPTRRECSTAVYPESFFFRVPLVTTDEDFARELCGGAALFVDPEDPVSMATAIHSAARDSQLRTYLTQLGAQQLHSSYPDADKKFRSQLAIIKRMAT